jgi:hypothetical protein
MMIDIRSSAGSGRSDMIELYGKICADYEAGDSIQRLSVKYGMGFYDIKSVLMDADTCMRTHSAACRTYNVYEQYFDHIDCEHKAYWLGFIATDGCVSDSSGGFRTILSLGVVDIDHLHKFSYDLEANKPILVDKRNIATQSISSKHMYESLVSIGITPRKTLTVAPAKIDAQLLRHFWRGCIDGDGWVCKYEKQNAWCIGFCGNKHMVNGFVDFIDENTGLGRKKPTYISRDNIYSVKYTGTKCKAILDMLYVGSSVYLSRKYEMYKTMCKDERYK